MKSLTLFIICILISINFVHNVRGIKWNGNNRTMDYDLHNNDFSNVQIRGEDYDDKCAHISDCTRFAWNLYNDSTCLIGWNKSQVTKDNAIEAWDILCGVIIESTSEEGGGETETAEDKGGITNLE
jgi:hypothetical protein